jgi:Domain of unknown function (DUF3883)
MARTDNADVREHLMIARVGWCTAYDGDEDDPPRDGGSYNRDYIGSEHRNFVPYDGSYFGYARSKGYLTLSRVGPKVQPDSVLREHVDDVCVAMIAKSQEFGQVLVGWYRHSRLFMAQQEHGQRGAFHWKCSVDDGVLLPVERRTLSIPQGKGAVGQANYGYSRDKDGKLLDRPYLDAIRRTILAWSPRDSSVVPVLSNEDAIVRGQGFQNDVRYRQEIEAHSMRLVGRTLRKLYRTVNDVSKERSYDFHCTSAKGEHRKIEVKGTTTPGRSVLVSRSEHELAQSEQVDLYVLHGIDIVGGVAQGGELTVYEDWVHSASSVKATGFRIVLATKGTNGPKR